MHTIRLSPEVEDKGQHSLLKTLAGLHISAFLRS